MKQRYFIAANILVYAIITVLLSGLQTSLWLKVFGSIPAPLFWITLTVFWALRKNWQEGLIHIYLSSLILTQFSALSFGMVLALQLIIFFAAHIFRQRIYWPGLSYLLMVNALALLVFHVSHVVLSWIFERNPITSFGFIRGLLEFIYLPLIVHPLEMLYGFVERLTRQQKRGLSHEEVV
jgi:hypothetical protein